MTSYLLIPNSLAALYGELNSLIIPNVIDWVQMLCTMFTQTNCCYHLRLCQEFRCQTLIRLASHPPPSLVYCYTRNCCLKFHTIWFTLAVSLMMSLGGWMLSSGRRQKEH